MCAESPESTYGLVDVDHVESVAPEFPVVSFMYLSVLDGLFPIENETVHIYPELYSHTTEVIDGCSASVALHIGSLFVPVLFRASL